MRNERRVTVYLSEEEYELLVERENESGKSRSKILKESLYREQNIMDAKFSDSIFTAELTKSSMITEISYLLFRKSFWNMKLY